LRGVLRRVLLLLLLLLRRVVWSDILLIGCGRNGWNCWNSWYVTSWMFFAYTKSSRLTLWGRTLL
jgi:hypothetical protein